MSDREKIHEYRIFSGRRGSKSFATMIWALEMQKAKTSFKCIVNTNQQVDYLVSNGVKPSNIVTSKEIDIANRNADPGKYR